MIDNPFKKIPDSGCPSAAKAAFQFLNRGAAHWGTTKNTHDCWNCFRDTAHHYPFEDLLCTASRGCVAKLVEFERYENSLKYVMAYEWKRQKSNDLLWSIAVDLCSTCGCRKYWSTRENSWWFDFGMKGFSSKVEKNRRSNKKHSKKNRSHSY